MYRASANVLVQYWLNTIENLIIGVASYQNSDRKKLIVQMLPPQANNTTDKCYLMRTLIS